MPARSPSRILIAVTTVVVVGLAASLLAIRPSPPSVAPPVAADRAETERLRAQVRRLEAQVGTLAGSRVRQATEAQAPASAGPAVSREQAEARARAVRGALFAALEEKLASEPTDGAWASGATETLSTAAARGVPYGTVQAVRCAATLCKLVVAHHEAEDARRFVEAFSADPPLEGQVVYQYDDGPSPRTIIWLSRKGEKLPRPPSG